MAAFSALHRALADFGEQAPLRPAFPRSAMSVAAEPTAPSFSAADLDRAVAQAEARLRESLTLEHLAARERAISEAVSQAVAAERRIHAEDIERVSGEQAIVMATAIADAMGELQEQVCEKVSAACARLLLPVLKEDAARRAVAALALVLRDALADTDSVRVTLSGPPALRAALQAELAGMAVQWQERDGESFDLRAAFNGQVVETRLAEWAETLKGFEA